MFGETVMSRLKPCADCGAKFIPGLYDDPRSPPLEEGPCLCESCHDAALDDAITDLEDRVKQLERTRFVPTGRSPRRRA